MSSSSVYNVSANFIGAVGTGATHSKKIKFYAVRVLRDGDSAYTEELFPCTIKGLASARALILVLENDHEIIHCRLVEIRANVMREIEIDTTMGEDPGL